MPLPRRTRPLLVPVVGSAMLALVASVATAAPSTAVPNTAAPVAAAAARPDPALSKKLGSVMSDSRVRKATSSAAVFDAGTGAELYARWGSRGTTPASNTKIFTAVAAMKTLGPGYRFKTEVIRRGSVRKGVLDGRLYLKGYGDPTARVSDYTSLAKQVRARGITRVTGALVADATFFDGTRYNPSWSTGYASSYYAAQTSALTVAPNSDLDSGTILLSYKPGTRGKAARVSVTPAAAAKYVTISNKTTTTAKGTSTTFSAKRAVGSNKITVTGRVALGRSTASTLITVNRPDLYAAAVFRAELSKVGVRVDGKTTALATPASSRHRLARDTSMTVSQLLVPFLKLSNNMHAEALTKTMGTLKGRPGSWSGGLAFTLAYARSLGAPMAGVKLVDGSGLTRSNKITTRAMGVLLYRVQKEQWFPAFYAALPVAGNPARMTGGTLRNRMKGTRAANNAHAKTGSLTGVTALSGYVKGADGRRYAFSMLSQYSGSSPRPVENTLVQTLAAWRR
jgi:D-alanyl-D-alanine carboxypeptidase/D-alanyl-D-alanine-endopeptidase (penicillin-binding protein 4)